MNEQELIIKHCLKPENIDTSFAVADVIPKIKEQILSDFVQSLPTVAKKMGLELEIDCNANLPLGKKGTGFFFYPEKTSKYCIYFYFDNDYDLYVYIDRIDRNKVPEDGIFNTKIRELLVSVNFGKTRSWSNEIWACEYDYWNNASWSEVQNGSFTEKIQATLEEIISKLKDVKL